MAEQRQKYSSDIAFNGSRISPEIQRRLEALQNSAAKDKFGYSKFSYDEGSGEQQMTYKDAFKSRNFDGAGELSSRKPWARIWTAIEPYDLSVDEDLTKKAIEEKQIKQTQTIYGIEPKEPIIYEFGNETWQSYMQQQKNPGSSLQDNEQSFLSNNPFMKPGISLNSVKTSTLTGNDGGTLKETTVDFTVFNMQDYENIVLPYFLRPAAEVFVDFGWDTAEAYPRKEHLKNKELLKKIFEVKNGYVDQSKGDMDVVYGLVTDFSSAVRPDGGWNCTITIGSASFALIDFHQGSGEELSPLFTEVINKTMVKYYNNAMGLSINPSFDNIYNLEDNKFLELALFNLKVRNNRRVYEGKTIEGVTFAPYELSDAEFSTGIAYQPFLGAIKSQSGKDFFDQLKTKEINPDYLTTERYTKEATMGSAEKMFNGDFAKNIFISFKWLEEFLNENLSFRSKEGKSSNLEFDFSSNICSWNALIYSRQNYLRFHPKEYEKSSAKVNFSEVMKADNLADNYSAAKWFLPSQRYKFSEYPDNYYVKKKAGSTFEGFTNIGNIFMRLDWVKSCFKTKDFRKALKKLINLINEESHGTMRLRLFSGGADTRIVMVDTNVPSYTKDFDNKDCQKEGGLFCIDELVTKKAGNNEPLVGMDADHHANLFAFSIQSPDSIVMDAQLSSNIQNNRLKNDLMLRTAPAGKPTYKLNSTWSDALVLKELMTHVSKGNVSTNNNVERHYDYLPGYESTTAEQSVVNDFKVNVYQKNEKYADSFDGDQFHFETMNAIYNVNVMNYNWKQDKWEENPLNEDGSEVAGGLRYQGHGEAVEYQVKPGDTLGAIARKYNTTYQKIEKWNKQHQVAPGVVGIPDINNLKVGYILLVSDPGKVVTHKSQQEMAARDELVESLNATEEEQKIKENDSEHDSAKVYHAYTIKDTQTLVYETNDPLDYFEKRLQEPRAWKETIGDFRVPIDLSMHIYGTSGIYPQNIFTIDYLPRVYYEKVYFRVLKVEQIITATSWKTGIQGAMLYRNAAEALEKSARGKSISDWSKTQVKMTMAGLRGMGYTEDDLSKFRNNPTLRDKWFTKNPGFAARTFLNTFTSHAAYGDDEHCAKWDKIRTDSSLSDIERQRLIQESNWTSAMDCYYDEEEKIRKSCWNGINNIFQTQGINGIIDHQYKGKIKMTTPNPDEPWDIVYVPEEDGGMTQADVDKVIDGLTLALYSDDSDYNTCCDPDITPWVCNVSNLDKCNDFWYRYGYLQECAGENTVWDGVSVSSAETNDGETAETAYNWQSCETDADCAQYGTGEMVCDTMRDINFRGCCGGGNNENKSMSCVGYGKANGGESLAVCRDPEQLEHPMKGGYNMGILVESGRNGCFGIEDFGITDPNSFVNATGGYDGNYFDLWKGVIPASQDGGAPVNGNHPAGMIEIDGGGLRGMVGFISATLDVSGQQSGMTYLPSTLHPSYYSIQGVPNAKDTSGFYHYIPKGFYNSTTFSIGPDGSTYRERVDAFFKGDIPPSKHYG